ncbi:actin filament-associated protein 1-like 2 isoform X1 [Astyanax mexicanus]|uniref:actin filament-associated protein 1-like 2 isoform X1 n=2 Tax=Astyanax mexicanus TaxID=7994 RepID=UPI000440DCF1|nr:actin filament-associated protein 1-like 2 isoform X1 [Astyanax mexicanus]
MEKQKVLEQLLEELQRFLKILDGEYLSGNASVQKSLLTDLLQSYKSSNGGDEEYIYMNKVIVTGQNQDKPDRDHRAEAEANGRSGKHVCAPQKSLPELPPPRTPLIAREPFPLPPAPACLESPEGYYEEAQPYDSAINDEGDAVSSSYESYDEEEVSKEQPSAAQHQWPSTEASIELMKDARICAFLWRKKWLGQWAKQLCVIRENRLLCYKSSKDQTPLLDVSLVGCSVIYKEKQLKRKEHKLKIIPQGGEAIVLGLQSKEQAEQWLKVIQEISPKSAENSDISDSPRLICTKGELNERYSVASESGSSTDSHAENLETKDAVKKKYGAGLKLSNLMNIGKKKISSLESPEKCVDTSGYLNVLVNSQWRTRWCLIKNGQLWFYQDKGKSKVSQQPVPLEGCMVLPDPSPEHLYSFRIQMDGEQLAILEAKSSADMGHWLGLLLSQTGTKTDPEDLTYDYVNSERISSIVNAAKTSLYLMQRRYSEPNTYTDSPPSNPNGSDDIYDDVASTENEQEDGQEGSSELVNSEQDGKDRVYLDLIPVRSFLHTSSGRVSPQSTPSPQTERSPTPTLTVETQDTANEDIKSAVSVYETSLPTTTECPDAPPPIAPRPDLDTPTSSSSSVQPQNHQTQLQNQHQQQHQTPHSQPQRTCLPSQEGPKKTTPHSPSNPRSHTLSQLHTPSHTPQSPPTARGRAASTDRFLDRLKPSAAACTGSIEVKLGKNRTEADVRRFTDERDRLEREREEVKNTLATLRKERREAKEELSSCKDSSKQASLEAFLKQREEACREAERRRVEVELSLVEVKDNLRKVEAGPFTLGTTVDSSLLETQPLVSVPTRPKAAPLAPAAPVNNGDSSPVNSATALKSRPLSIMAASKGNVLQKAKEWEKKSTT